MPLSKNINTYADVRNVLNTARVSGGAVYTLGSVNEAIRWRQRAYYLRTLLFERDGFTAFDEMKLVLEANVVKISFDAAQVGTLKGLDGKKLKPVIEADDDLLATAQQLAKELGKK